MKSLDVGSSAVLGTLALSVCCSELVSEALSVNSYSSHSYPLVLIVTRF